MGLGFWGELALGLGRTRARVAEGNGGEGVSLYSCSSLTPHASLVSTDLSAFVTRNPKHASPVQRVIHGFPLTSPVRGRSEMQRWYSKDLPWLYFVHTHQVDTIFLSILRLGLNFAKEATLESPKLMLYHDRRSRFSSYQEEFDFEMSHGFGEFLKVTEQNLMVCHGDIPRGLTLLLANPTKGRQDWILP